MRIRHVNSESVDKKDYLYQPRLFRGGWRTAGKCSGRGGFTFFAGVLTGALLTLLSLLLYPQGVMALLRMAVQGIYAMGYKS